MVPPDTVVRSVVMNQIRAMYRQLYPMMARQDLKSNELDFDLALLVTDTALGLRHFDSVNDLRFVCTIGRGLLVKYSS